MTIFNKVRRYEQNNVKHSNVGILDQILISNEHNVLKEMMGVFGNRPFMLHHSQALDQYPPVNVYKHKLDVFIKQVREVLRSSVLRDANNISSHTLYKVKTNDNSSLQQNAITAPHGNDDTIKDEIKSDCCMRPPIGIRLILSAASMRK